jgi:hypothetical protein
VLNREYLRRFSEKMIFNGKVSSVAEDNPGVAVKARNRNRKTAKL